MKKRIAVVLLGALIPLPFIANILGRNLFAYFNFGENDLILAASQGLSHNAWAKHSDVRDSDLYDVATQYGLDIPDAQPSTIIDVGFLHLFSERRIDPMTPFTFRASGFHEDSEYSAVELPWILLLSVPLAVAFLSNRQSKQKEAEQAGDGDAEEAV